MTDCLACKGKGEVDGIGPRECFVPRRGWCYVDVDYPSLELRTLAQVCYVVLGRSTLGDLYQKDPNADPHSMFGARLLGCSYEEALKRKEDKKDVDADDARQAGKVCNFGLPGGLGARRLCDYAYKSYGVRMKDLCTGQAFDPDDPRAVKVAEGHKANWEATWPEMDRRDPQGYFAWIRSLHDPRTDLYRMEAPVTGVVRAGMTYTECANNPFQHLGAACAKRGLWLVDDACWDPTSVLFGAHIANFIHDQLLVEVPCDIWGPDRTHAAAWEVARLFEAGAREFLPDVPIPVDPILTSCWSKKAKAVKDSQGRLKVWTP